MTEVQPTNWPVLVAGNSTWYDVPAPTIVHQRSFDEQDAVYQNQARGSYRHSSSIELTATSSVHTDADGVPTITFSFHEGGKTSELYDFPRRSAPPTEPSNVYDEVDAPGRPGGASTTGASVKKRKLWPRLRSWLSDERTRFSEVVARHARLQAVGARIDDVLDESGSYDLDRARRRQTPSNGLPTVEEFGPRRLMQPIKKTQSSDDILDDARQSAARPKPTSFSLERLCSDDEADDRRKEKNKGPRARLAKSRMLGSIRGLLVASTHRLHEDDEVLRLELR